MIRLHLRLVAFVCAIACVAGAAVSLYPATRLARVEDRKADRRVDLWHAYADHREQTEVDIDTNADGRPDVQEYYEHGTLVRRESDRNFDDQVDLVEEFDSHTREHVRSVVDVDYDGTADLLVLFRDGRPVFSKYASPSRPLVETRRETTRPAPRRHGLSALNDPFRIDAALRRTLSVSPRGDGADLETDGGLPSAPAEADAAIVTTPLLAAAGDRPALPSLVPASPRAPPLS